ALVRAHPRRENLCELQMLALYRAGRQADALTVYRDTRAKLVDELGLEPSHALRRLEQAILRRDPSLEPAAGPPPSESADSPGTSLESLKTVTVVFCDIGPETLSGNELDPESLRLVVARSFEVAAAAVERHGGAVEKFVGDEVMAVFGIPVVRENDALRA